MAPALQAKMLRLLQEQQFERVGGNETVQTNVRVLAATNQDLEKLVAEGRFRKDLYYRLRGVTIRVPPLRERPGDVAELAHYFLFRFNRELGTDFRGLDPRRPASCWKATPGPATSANCKACLRQAMLQGAGHILLPEFLPQDFPRAGLVPTAEPSSLPVASPEEPSLSTLIEKLLAENPHNLHTRAVEALERLLLPRVLKHTQGHQTQAAEILGLSRGTLRQKLKNLGFSIDKVFTEEGETERPEPQ